MENSEITFSARPSLVASARLTGGSQRQEICWKGAITFNDEDIAHGDIRPPVMAGKSPEMAGAHGEKWNILALDGESSGKPSSIAGV